jgi:hypothetical protein
MLFVVLKVVIVKPTVVWDVTPCSLLELTDVSELEFPNESGDGLDGWSSIPATGNLFSITFETGPWAHRASCPMGTGGKAAGRKADHSLAYNAEVKNCGAIPPTPTRTSL